MRSKYLAAAVLAALMSSSCGSPARKSETAEGAPAKGGAADISTTRLADANYATPQLLEARKAGLARESAELADPAKAGSVDPIAIDPYNRSDYPDVVRKWGGLIPTINRERKVAALIAARDPRCDGVTNAQITGGGTRADRHYMTECNNLTRVYFDARSLAEHRAALVRTEADMGAQGVLDW